MGIPPPGEYVSDRVFAVLPGSGSGGARGGYYGGDGYGLLHFLSLEGIPENWIETPSSKGGGTIYAGIQKSELLCCVMPGISIVRILGSKNLM